MDLETEKKWYDQLSFDEQQEIEIGISQADNNDFVSHDDVMNLFQKYKNNNIVLS